MDQRSLNQIAERSQEHFREALQEYVQTQISLRTEIRGIWDRMVLMSSGIVGFSASLLGTRGFGVGLNLSYLKISWGLFFFNILLGIFILILENKRKSYEMLRRTVFISDQHLIDSDFAERKISEQERNRRLAALILLDAEEPLLNESQRQLVEREKSNLLIWTGLKRPWYLPRVKTLDYIAYGFYATFLFALVFLVYSIW